MRTGDSARIGCYPGSFNPPTVAHLAVAEAALDVGNLDRIDLVVSRVGLGKEGLVLPTLDDRLSVLRDVAATRPWLGVVVSHHQLIADLAEGYDAVVMGADKWRQVNDARWYGDDAGARDAVLNRLPPVLVAPRADDCLAEVAELTGVLLLSVAEHHRLVNATAIRSGEPGAHAWMLSEAATFDARTHAWSDPGRYRAGGNPGRDS